MVRPPRIELAGGVFHLVARGNERALVFRDDQDRERFLEILEGVAGRYRWRVLAYCLMGNHFHLLVMMLEPTLARGMRQGLPQILSAGYLQHVRSRIPQVVARPMIPIVIASTERG